MMESFAVRKGLEHPASAIEVHELLFQLMELLGANHLSRALTRGHTLATKRPRNAMALRSPPKPCAPLGQLGSPQSK